VRTRRRASLHQNAALKLALGIVAALTLAATPAWSCNGPGRMADGWDIAAFADAGLDQAVICRLADAMAGQNKDNLHAVLVARNDALVFEAYGKGSDRSDGRDLGVVEHGPAAKAQERGKHHHEQNEARRNRSVDEIGLRHGPSPPIR